jgi:hypothetical protein
LIQLLKKWRTANELTQAEAVKVFHEQGLPVTLDTLQNWEIGRRAPRSLSRSPFRFSETTFQNHKMSQLLNPVFNSHRKLLELANDGRPYVVVELDEMLEPTPVAGYSYFILHFGGRHDGTRCRHRIS